MADLTEPLPSGPFDLVVSALAIHHLNRLEDAGFVPLTNWSEHDLVVGRGDRPA